MFHPLMNNDRDDVVLQSWLHNRDIRIVFVMTNASEIQALLDFKMALTLTLFK